MMALDAAKAFVIMKFTTATMAVVAKKFSTGWTKNYSLRQLGVPGTAQVEHAMLIKNQLSQNKA